MFSSIPGISIGHYTNATAQTGCTVILCPPETIGSCDICGSSPGSRETGLLDPTKSMQQVNAILLSGGSAFGLAAADGVVKYLLEQNQGYSTPWGLVPIVPAAVIFDLNKGDSSIRPTAENGYQACCAAKEKSDSCGLIGAGTGATIGKWQNFENRMAGGLGTAETIVDDLIVSAVAVVNAIGDIYGADGTIIAGARMKDGSFCAKRGVRYGETKLPLHTNTTLVTVATNAILNKTAVYNMCRRSQTGMSRAIKPVHTAHDGDCVFGLSTRKVQAPLELVLETAADVTAQAIRAAVGAK